MSNKKTIDISVDGLYMHLVGDSKCRDGWCGKFHYPKPCKCGGLIHADIGYEDAEVYWLYTKCDKCGESE